MQRRYISALLPYGPGPTCDHLHRTVTGAERCAARSNAVPNEDIREWQVAAVDATDSYPNDTLLSLTDAEAELLC